MHYLTGGLRFFDEHAGAVTAIFTVFLAISTILLWAAARRSLRAVIAADRPRLQLSKLTFHRGAEAEPRDNSKYAMVRVGFTNYGGKSALVTELCVEQLFAEMVPRRPNYRDKRQYLSYPITIAPGTEHLFPDLIVDDKENRQLAEILNRQKPSKLRFWIYGYIAYVDHVGEIHRTGFIGSWNWYGTGSDQLPDEARQRGETFDIFQRKYYTYST
jgi:hypothetical protein